jgi:hypothetical protein
VSYFLKVYSSDNSIFSFVFFQQIIHKNNPFMLKYNVIHTQTFGMSSSNMEQWLLRNGKKGRGILVGREGEGRRLRWTVYG